MSSLNIIFAGTPDFAAQHLQALIASDHNILGVYTQPDRPSGRGKKVSTSPVKDLAQRYDLPIFQPATLKDKEAQAQLEALKSDLMVVVAYGLLLPGAVLAMPKYGCINVHGSILPKWRGAAPIQRAVQAGDAVTGVTIMQMDEGLDTGDMLHIAECPIRTHDTSGDIYQRLADIGPPALLQVIGDFDAYRTRATKQIEEHSSYARKIDKIEAEIDWHQSADVIDRKIRAFNPSPICYSALGEERLRIHLAKPVSSVSTHQVPGLLTVTDERILVQCGEGQLEILRLQLPGKKAMDAAEFLNGLRQTLQAKSGDVVLGRR